ncbi:hypothetical protein MNV49_005152 [Pseudohyphozyma bogoriensis]|nr:hypothetical protein MNV49_005152 [Pseudohyphozyma bogoriensis]
MSPYKGPLTGIRVLELAGLAPAPFAGIFLLSGKRSIAVSLKTPAGVELVKTLLSKPSPAAKNGAQQQWRADVLIDPFRPGVLERLGLDPEALMKANPSLIVARITGFRRDGPYSAMAGHDINYISLSGLLDMMGRKGEKPYPPLNLLADFAGGGLMASQGILLALFERNKTGKGQIVEVDMLTGARYMASFPLMLHRPSLGHPMFAHPRGENVLDTGAPFYEVYETSDGKHMSVDWTRIFLGTDACCVPVLSPNEVDSEGIEIERKSEEDELDGGTPAPRPVLKSTPARKIRGSRWEGTEDYYLEPGMHTKEVLILLAHFHLVHHDPEVELQLLELLNQFGNVSGGHIWVKDGSPGTIHYAVQSLTNSRDIFVPTDHQWVIHPSTPHQRVYISRDTQHSPSSQIRLTFYKMPDGRESPLFYIILDRVENPNPLRPGRPGGAQALGASSVFVASSLGRARPRVNVLKH